MKYMGSKGRIAKQILPIMLSYKDDDQAWVEPFVGGANLIDKVSSGLRIGSDLNPDVINALITIRDKLHLLPKDNTEFSENDYKNVKMKTDHPLRSYVGFALSYGGKWFGGWRRDKDGKRDYVREAYRNAEKQSPLIQDVNLIVSDYKDLEIPPRSLIYCDPPYECTTGYSVGLDHNAFWEWCRTKSREGHIVFVSEYSAPDDFECLWSKKVSSSLTSNTGGKRNTEKLFLCTTK